LNKPPYCICKPPGKRLLRKRAYSNATSLAQSRQKRGIAKMEIVVVLDLISVFLSVIVFSLAYKLRPSFKSLLRPALFVFYSVNILVLALAILELIGFLTPNDTPFNLGLHFGILGIMLLIVLSLNKMRVNQLRNELRETKAVNKMKTEFLARTSHELKTPLTPLLMQLQLLQKGNFGKMAPKQEESVVMIERNIKRLNALITDILYYSRSSAGKLKLDKKPTSLKPLFENVVRIMSNKARTKEISISLKIGKIPLVDCDSNRVTEVVINLIDNAIKFSEKKSQILVEIKKEKKHAVVSIKDTGIGISKENMPKLFFPFTQFSTVSTREHGGTGIGLSISQNLVKLHGGKIWAESKGLGKGATFYFTLPIKK